MNENVQIKIRSTQYADHEESVIESSSFGKYHAFSDMQSVLYEENSLDKNNQDTVISKNIMKIQKDRFTITKKGMIKTEMRFQTGSVYNGLYQTPYGVFNMTIHTKHLHILSTTEQISISIDYALELNGQYASDNHMSIEIFDGSSL